MNCQFCGAEIEMGDTLCKRCSKRGEEPVTPLKARPLSPQTTQSPPSPSTPRPPVSQRFSTLKELLPVAEIREALKNDPAMLAVFAILGFFAIDAFVKVVIYGPIPYYMLLVIGFLGILSWRYWGWVLVMFVYGLGLTFAIYPAIKLLIQRHDFASMMIVVRVVLYAFVVVVLWLRRDYFD